MSSFCLNCITGSVKQFLIESYVILSVLPKLKQTDKHLSGAAQDLGCTPLQAFFKVVIPSILPGVLSGMMMAFTLSLDDFIISNFTY